MPLSSDWDRRLGGASSSALTASCASLLCPGVTPSAHRKDSWEPLPRSLGAASGMSVPGRRSSARPQPQRQPPPPAPFPPAPGHPYPQGGSLWLHCAAQAPEGPWRSDHVPIIGAKDPCHLSQLQSHSGTTPTPPACTQRPSLTQPSRGAVRGTLARGRAACFGAPILRREEQAAG